LNAQEEQDQLRDLERIRLYAEGEHLIPEMLEKTAQKLVDKAAQDVDFEADKEDKQQLEVLAVK